MKYHLNKVFLSEQRLTQETKDSQNFEGRAGEMTGLVKGLVAKPDYLSSSLETHLMEEDK